MVYFLLKKSPNIRGQSFLDQQGKRFLQVPEVTDLNVTGAKSRLLFLFVIASMQLLCSLLTGLTGHAEGRPWLGSTKGVASGI